MTGTVEFGNGFVLDVGERVEQLDITESSSVSVSTVTHCGAAAARYLEIFDEELAEPDLVLLDRLRAYERIVDFARENDCGPRDLAVPVCAAAGATSAPESLLERHLQLCPDAQEAVEALVFEPRFDDGVVRLVLPPTTDGLPAYSVAMIWPAWTVETTSEGPSRQKIALSADPETVGRFTRLDIDVSATPASLLEARAAAAVEPESPDAQTVLADRTTIGGLPARRLIAQLEPGAPIFQVGTAVEIDDERLLKITGIIVGRPEFPVDSDGISALMACIESSMVIVAYDPDVEPAPADDCTSITSLGPNIEPALDAVEPETESAEDAAPVAPDAPDAPDASFDGSTITIVTPGADGGPNHVTTVGTPGWTVAEIDTSFARQLVKVDDGDDLTYVSEAVAFASRPSSTVDRLAEPLSSSWTIVSDNESQALGERTLRIVMTERENSDGVLSRTGKIITPIDQNHVLVVQVKVFAGNSADFDGIFHAALTSLTITP